ncbi:MAG TPA: class I adenylate-forming enzyme family protein [Actinomycetales bacterium]|nr:class I adenylate-forming enzyme family protein [Actinomycetales bacterium]
MSAHLLAPIYARANESDAANSVAIRWWNFGRRRARPGTSLTYAQLTERIDGTARGLVRHGLQPGDRVLFSIRPRPAGIVLALAIVRAGGSVVFADLGSTPELFAARIAAAQPRFAATESLIYALGRGPLRAIARRRGLLLPDYAKLDVRHIYAGMRLPGVPKGAVAARHLSGAARRGFARGLELPELDASREALIVFTSGTTSDPKAVVHSSASLQAAATLFNEAFQIEPGDVIHTEQLLLGLPALQNGAEWSLPATGPDKRLQQFAAGLSAAAGTYLVPHDLDRLINAAAAGEVSSAGPRIGLVGGGPVPADLLRRAEKMFPATQWRAVYGMTEILPVAVADLAAKSASLELGDVVGQPLPGVTARLTSEPIGELVLSGPNLMSGYLNAQPAQEQHTGDLARIGPEGEIILVGRKKDMLIRGQTNIYPGLFEPRITDLAGVANVALVGLPTSYGDDRIVLVLQPEVWEQPDTRFALDHPVLTAVRRELPAIIDHAAQPDLVLATRELPTAGRSTKLDRAALSEVVGAWLRAREN